MFKRIKAISSHPVGATVVGGLILATILATLRWGASLPVVAAISSVGDWLTESSHLTHFDVFLFALALVAIAGFSRRGFRRTDSHVRYNYVDLNRRLLKFEYPEVAQVDDLEPPAGEVAAGTTTPKVELKTANFDPDMFEITPPRCRALLALLRRIDAKTTLHELYQYVFEQVPYIDLQTTKAQLQRDMEDAERAGIVTIERLGTYTQYYSLAVPQGRDWVLGQKVQFDAQVLGGMTRRDMRSPHL